MPKQFIPLVLAVCCMFVYAVIIVMLKRLSSKYNVFVIGVSYMPIQFAATALMLWMTKNGSSSYQFPAGNVWWFILALGLLYTLGSTLNYQAYATGGSVAMVSAVTLLMPVFASLIAFVLSRDTPNAWQLAAYGAGVVMILLMIKGSAVQQAAKLALAIQ